MQKPDSLRAALTAVVPALTRDPDRLKIFIDKGTIATRMGPRFGFEYRYRLVGELLDFDASAPEAIFFALTLWLAEHQPDLLLNHQRGSSAISFNAELVDAATIDLIFEIELTEAIGAEPRAGGGHDLVHLPEPQIPTFEPDPPGVTLQQLWWKDEIILQVAPAP